jgi:hypothetical protein
MPQPLDVTRTLDAFPIPLHFIPSHAIHSFARPLTHFRGIHAPSKHSLKFTTDELSQTDDLLYCVSFSLS